MKNKLLVIALALFLPLMCWGQISVEYAYKNKVLEVTITNETDKELMLVNERHKHDANSFLDARFLDRKKKTVFHRRYSFGETVYVLFKPNAKKIFSYHVRGDDVEVDEIKNIEKVEMELLVVCIVHGEEAVHYEEKKVLTVK